MKGSKLSSILATLVCVSNHVMYAEGTSAMAASMATLTLSSWCNSVVRATPYFDRLVQEEEQEEREEDDGADDKDEDEEDPDSLPSPPKIESPKEGDPIDYAHQLPPAPNGTVRLTRARDMIFPLVGIGCGNLHRDDVFHIIRGAPEQLDNIPLMIDTAHKSGNEDKVLEGIIAREERLGPLPSNLKRTYHVVTKVWYTHLGYERTKISVDESLQRLRPPAEHDGFNVKVTMLLHWPRCRDDIEWMDCAGEEAALPDSIRDLPSPEESPRASLLGSWRALEELFEAKQLDAIGISNFEPSDIATLKEEATVMPHIHQLNLWQVMHKSSSEEMLAAMRESDVLFQFYNIMSVFANEQRAIGAFRFLWEIGHVRSEPGRPIEPQTMGLKSLVQSHVSIIPRTTKWEHLRDNSIGNLLSIVPLNDEEMLMAHEAMESLVNNQDSELFEEFAAHRRREAVEERAASSDHRQVEARFVNALDRHTVQLFWVHPGTGEKHDASEPIPPGDTVVVKSYWHHVFHAHIIGDDPQKARPLKEFVVQATPRHARNAHQTFHVEF